MGVPSPIRMPFAVHAGIESQRWLGKGTGDLRAAGVAGHQGVAG